MKKNKFSIQFSVLTLFPELIQNYLGDALLSKAIQQNRIQVRVISLRPFSEARYKSIDDVPYGGGDGMVFKASVLESALNSLNQQTKQDTPTRKRIIYLSPQGRTWNHVLAKKMASEWSNPVFDEDKELSSVDQEIVLICGRYAGIDQRFIQKYVDEEISIGDYVLSGGELAALVVIESISRYIPGVLGDENSANFDSFEDQGLEAPQFTKPQDWSNLKVPEVLASGNHQKINAWKKNVAALVTFKKRPDLFKAYFKKSELNHLIVFYKSLPAEELKVLQLEDLDFGEL